MKTLGMTLLMLGVLVLGVLLLAFVAIIGGPWGLFVFAIFGGCALWGVSDWYRLRLRRKRSLRVTPSPDTP